MNDQITPTARTRVKRGPKRGVLDRAKIYQVIDSTPLCHIAYLLDGQPALTPTLHWRAGDRIFWHGSSASRTLRRSEKNEICLNVTRLDGYVLARSAFHHSVNYRSVTIFGVPELIEDASAKADALQAMVDHMIPGRWPGLRPMTAKELKATAVLSMPIDEVSAKIRTGGPEDDEEDYALPIWAGTVPIARNFGAAIADDRLDPSVEMPAHVSKLIEKPTS